MESSQSGALRRAIDDLNEQDAVARFVIDEAHCISQWGHDFRKSYQSLSFIRSTWRDIPIVAFTATASRNFSIKYQQLTF